MADEARAMLDALMGADRNAPVEGASGVNNSNNSGGAPRGRKKSCYDNDAETVAAKIQVGCNLQ